MKVLFASILSGLRLQKLQILCTDIFISSLILVSTRGPANSFSAVF